MRGVARLRASMRGLPESLTALAVGLTATMMSAFFVYSSIRWLNAQSTSILKPPPSPDNQNHTQAPNLLPCPAVPAVSLHPTP